jgi:GLPGLI family protein
MCNALTINQSVFIHLLFLGLVCGQDTYLIEYEMQFNYDHYDSASLYNHKCQLYVNEEESLYKYKNSISISDDPSVKNITTHVYIDVFSGQSKIDYLELADEGFQVYSDEEWLINKEVISKSEYIIKERIDYSDWIYTDSTRLILDHTCFLAVKNYRGRTYHVWFNPDISKIFHKGPWKLLGLPGLVYEVYSTDNAIKIYLKSPVPEKVDYKINAPKNGEEISISEYWEHYLAHRKTDFDRAHNGVIKNLISAGLDPSSYQFPIYHNSMEIINPSLSEFEKWAIIRE